MRTYSPTPRCAAWCAHGRVIRRAEQAEVATVATRDDLAGLDLALVPLDQPRRRAGWPAALNAAVDAALARKQVRPPDGVSRADWERVLAARRADAARPVEELRRLGPAVEPQQVLLTVDEVLTRKPAVGHFLELRTARIVTARGSRYLSGVGAAFLPRLHLAALLCLGSVGSLLLISDGARWIRSFFSETLARIAPRPCCLTGTTSNRSATTWAAESATARRPRRTSCAGCTGACGAVMCQAHWRCWRRSAARPGMRRSWTS